MAQPDKQKFKMPDFYVVSYNGYDVLVDHPIGVPEVPDDAPLLMEAGGGYLKMYAATALDKWPLDMTFPVYVESPEMASLVPVESALRRANWTIPSDSVLNDRSVIDGLKKSTSPQ
jgi:hypothetical protein